MTLKVHTARINYRGDDRLDITRKTGGPIGELFAPSWELLKPVLRARRIVEHQRRTGRDDGHAVELEAWRAYVPGFHAEMRESYREHREEWEMILSRESVTFLCYCTPNVDSVLRCHRVLLAGYFGRLGAIVVGERVEPKTIGTCRGWK